MPIPQFPAKHGGRPYVTPHQLISYRAGVGRPVDRAPRAIVLCWQGRFFDEVRRRRDHRQLDGPGEVLLELAGTPSPALETAAGVGVARLGIGAPTAAIVVEELAALGVERVVGLGFAGAIATGLNVGDLVVCSAAVRDEGTSHHYVAPERLALPDPQLTATLHGALGSAALGPTWTTDAPYRETAEEIEHYRSDGVLTVDMEAAAVFAVSSAVGIRAASLFCISDVLSGPTWRPKFHAGDLVASMFAAFEQVEKVLAAIGGAS